jgi:AbiU2
MPISLEAALERADAIVPMLASDVRIALAVCATFQSGHDTIIDNLRGMPKPGADTFDLIESSLALKLALDIAKIYDEAQARPLDSQDKASIPVLAHHLGRNDVRDALADRARQWTPQFPDLEPMHVRCCETAIDNVTGWRLRLGTAGLEALERVRELRNRRLAHSLYDRDPNPVPPYNDLFDLLRHARDIAGAALLAVRGEGANLSEDEAFLREEADRFWAIVLSALRAAE